MAICSRESVIARDLGVAGPREIERETAPAAADVENAMAGLDEQLGGYVALLGELALIQRLLRRLEIGAGI